MTEILTTSKQTLVNRAGTANEFEQVSLKQFVSKIGSGKTPRGGNETYVSDGVTFLRSQNVHFDGLRLDDVVFIEANTHREMSNTALQPNDVLLNITGASLGRASIVPPDLVPANVNQHVCICRPRKDRAEARFLLYSLQSKSVQRLVWGNQVGASREGLNFEEVGALPIHVPLAGVRVQQAIANFLDRKTAAIDDLIAKKERLIELLEEKRAALINQAVTKGLDPTAPMKDSGIPWIGRLPTNWGHTKVKFVTTKIVDGTHHTPTYVDEGVPFITVKNLTAGRGISFDDTKFISPEEHAILSKRICPRRGDVLLSKDGTLGVPRVVATDRVFNIFVSVAVIRPMPALVDSYFPRYEFESAAVAEQFVAKKAGSGLQHLHLNEIGNVVFALPPLLAQRRIVDQLRARLTGVDNILGKARRQLGLMSEYRQSLITAAVTGQLDIKAAEGEAA